LFDFDYPNITPLIFYPRPVATKSALKQLFHKFNHD